MLRINNKEILDTIHEKYPDLVITKIYSDKEQVIIQGQDEEAFKNIKKGVISKSTQSSIDYFHYGLWYKFRG